VFSLTVSLLAIAAQRPAQRAEEDFFKNWLEQDVVYILTKDELAAAKRLTTPEEQDAFIRTFWERRDPTPGTIANEYRDEHYRRIAYANEKYTTATDGWRTDRGKIYIRFGAPDNVDSNLSAGSTTMRSGKNRMTVPFETWDYRNIPGIGPAKLTFVDRTMTGHFELSLNPGDKIAKFSNEDIALFDANDLMTMSETPDSIDWSKRVNQYIAVQRPPEIRFKDLKAMVGVRLNFNLLPFIVRTDALRGPGDKSMVPITLEFDPSGLTFQDGVSGKRAQVNVYGVITDLSSRVAYEFEDDVSLNDGIHFQRFAALDPGRYKLTIVAKDVGSGRTGSRDHVIAISRPQRNLQTSSLMLSDVLVPAAPTETLLDNFVISQYKVRPLVKLEISRTMPLGIYQEIYEFATDANSGQPEITASVQIFKKGQAAEILNSSVSAQELSTRYIDRLLFAKTLRIPDLPPGEYIVRVTVSDRIKNERVVSESPLTLKN